VLRANHLDDLRKGGKIVGLPDRKVQVKAGA
jgi:hypothetical protein